MKATKKMIWDSEDWVCAYCGAPNPDRHDKCGNCDKNPFVLPNKDEWLTAEQLATFRAATRTHSKKEE